ncbi:MAG: type II secretion system F family protein [Micrococcaceae bacterium]
MLAVSTFTYYTKPISWQRYLGTKNKQETNKENQQEVQLTSLLRELISWLEAGVNPNEVFKKVSSDSNTKVYFAKIVQGVEIAQTVPTALLINLDYAPKEMKEGFVQLARIWQVSNDSGCSLQEVLLNLAAHFDAQEDKVRSKAKALASPAASAKVLLILPLLSLGISTIFGLIDFRILLSSPPALISIFIGLLLNGGAYLWAQKLLKEVSI